MRWWEAQVGRPQKEGKEEEEEEGQFQLEELEVVSVGCLSITLSVTQRPFPLQLPRPQLLSVCCKSRGNPATPRNQLPRSPAGVSSSGRGGRATETW